MKFAVHAVFGLSLAFAAPVFAAAAAPASSSSTVASAAATTAAAVAAPNAAHVAAVRDLLGAMHAENVLRGVAGRSRYANDAQRQAVFAKLDKTPPAEVYGRLAAPMARVISADTATEMTRFYNTPYGKQVIQKKYNSGVQLMMPGAKPAVAPEEKKERKRAAYVQASKELADAEPTLQSEAFKLLQLISKEKR